MGERLRVAVVGDWVVDDHWVTGVHRSATSSRTGRGHFRALHGLDSVVESIGACGRVASVLRRAGEGEPPSLDVLGVGIWHKSDTRAIASMLEPPPLSKQRNRHRVTRSTSTLPAGVDLVNLNETLVKLRGRAGGRGTTRVIRVYQQTGARLDLIQRIDWELPLTDLHRIRSEEKAVFDQSSLDEALDQCQVDAVVVKDICKGVVSEGLVDWLVKKLGDVPWFVSTKEWRPAWLPCLHAADVRLLVIPQVPAQTAVRNALLSHWLTPSATISKEAMDVLEEIVAPFAKQPTVLVLPIGSSALAVEPDGNCHIQVEERLQEHAVSVPMASVMFPSLVWGLLTRNACEFRRLLEDAFSFTHSWMSWNADQIEACDTWVPGAEPRFEPDTVWEDEVRFNWESADWSDERVKWDCALQEVGVITEKARKTLELWRAMSELQDYVCCVQSKRSRLRSLLTELGAFSASLEKRSRGFMLVAPPGFGKTHLVTCLAKALGFRLLAFDITQMLSREDILASLDTMVTTQSSDAGEPIMVFFDEINATVDNQHVYDFFLSPLEGNTYVRSGKAFHLAPALWLFAGTEPLVDPADPLRDRSSKASDLQSRLTCAPFEFSFDSADAEEARVEHVYMGASLLRSAFPDVRRISEKVLWLFHLLPADLQVRDLRNVVRRFERIQYGEVVAANAPSKWVETNHGFPLVNWENRPEGALVDIVG